MIIELYGPPGAGKSTFARKLLETRHFTRVRHSSLVVMVFFSLVYTLRHPLNAFRFFTFVLRYGAGRKLLYFKLINVYLQYTAKWARATLSMRDVIIDQGHYQSVISLFETPVEGSVIRALRETFPKPDMLIVFDLPEEVLEERVRERQYGSVRDAVSEGARRAWEAAMRANHRTLLSLLAGDASVRMVHTDADLAQLTSELCSRQ